MQKTIKKYIITFGLLVIIIIAFVLINEEVSERNLRSYKPKEDSNKYAYQVENAVIEGEDLVIKGWFFELRKVKNVELDIQNDRKLGVLLIPVNSNGKLNNYSDGSKEGIKMQMEYQSRLDVNSYFLCEYDYSNCGFTAKINRSVLDLENTDYQVVFKPEETGEDGIESLVYIHKGSISYVNPQDIVELDVAGTDIEKIVNDGMCVLSYPEYHVYVYQYGWDLYYIVEEGFKFKNNNTFVELLFDTTQFERIEDYHPNYEWYDVDIGGYFEKGEVTNTIDCGEYRVYKNNMDKGYSIIKAITGCYSGNEWIWRKPFRPYYDIKNVFYKKEE